MPLSRRLLIRTPLIMLLVVISLNGLSWPSARAAHADTTWQGVNNGLYGGNVLSLGVSPGYATDQTLFAGTNGGGVFRSPPTATPTPEPVPLVSTWGIVALAAVFGWLLAASSGKRRKFGMSF